MRIPSSSPGSRSFPASLVLNQDLNGNDLNLPYTVNLSGTGINHRFAWLNQMGALVNLDGNNTITGDIYLNGGAGIGVELDGAVQPYSNPSQLVLTGAIHDDASPGQLIKLGTQRLILQGAGTYTGGVDIQQGVLLIENDTALGLGTPAANVTTTVESGAALELGSTIPAFTGGIQGGLQTWYTDLVLNGTGNAAFGDAALMVEANDNMWRGPITLKANIAVTFQGPEANMAVPTILTTVNSPTGGSVSAVTSTAGGPGINAVQTLTFGGTFAVGDTFTLVVSKDGSTDQQTAPIAWSANRNTLVANIETALKAPSLETLFSAGVGFAQVALLSPAINIFPNARLTVAGVIGDGANPADISLSGGGELSLAGSNTYHGTTYVNQGILTIQNAKALGSGPTAQVQTVTLSAATILPTPTRFTLSFNGHATSALTYTGTPADAVMLQNALDALPSIGGVGGSVTVVVNLSDLASPVFTLTLGGALSGFNQPLVTVPSISTGAATPFVVTDGSGGTVVANGAQVQLQGGITVVGEPIIIAGTGNPLATEVQSVSVTGAKFGSFQLTFTNPNPISTTSTTVSLPIGASAAQVQNALNALASIQAGNGAGGGSVLVNESGWNVSTVLFQGTFVGASQPWSKQAVTVRGQRNV